MATNIMYAFVILSPLCILLPEKKYLLAACVIAWEIMLFFLGKIDGYHKAMKEVEWKRRGF